MSLDLCDSIESKSILRLPSDEFVDKISGFVAPGVRNLAFLQLNIFSKHEVSYFVPGPAVVGPLASHEFIADDSDCKVV